MSAGQFAGLTLSAASREMLSRQDRWDREATQAETEQREYAAGRAASRAAMIVEGNEARDIEARAAMARGERLEQEARDERVAALEGCRQRAVLSGGSWRTPQEILAALRGPVPPV